MSRLAKDIMAIRTAALSYPETREDFPWGERVFKVRGKIFCFLSEQKDGHCVFTVKLPVSHLFAKELPGVKPTGYGLGKSGWVSLTFAPADRPDKAMLLAWLEESYRAVAPKALVKQLDS